MELKYDYWQRTEWEIYTVKERNTPNDPAAPKERIRLFTRSNLPPRLKKCTGKEEHLTATYWG